MRDKKYKWHRKANHPFFQNKNQSIIYIDSHHHTPKKTPNFTEKLPFSLCFSHQKFQPTNQPTNKPTKRKFFTTN